ncbi:MAG: cbb3-type cytochrome c oxidase subunit I, partial [Myxococcales bacterium]|nr:cbb3-type cytochrome c oxidase subunit I [Myxococcales bacterium]
MNATTTQAAVDHADAPYEVDYLNCKKGIRHWLITVDHKRIGVMYLWSVIASFLLGGVLALLIRAELWGPGETIMGPDTYNRVFTLHGLAMVFLFIIPGIPAAFGNFVLPLMLGAKDVA